MDAGRIWLISAIASVSFGLQIACAATQSAGGPAEHTANFAGQAGWSGAGSTTPAQINAAPSYSAPSYTAPSYTAPSYDRYGTPAPGNASAFGQPATISQRTQNAVGETATTLRDGLNAGVRAAKDGSQGFSQQLQDWSGAATQQLQSAGSSVRSAAEQALGTSSNQPKYSNPFAPPAPAPAPAPATSSGIRGNSAPPPWPSSSPATPMAPAQNWPDSTSAAISAAPTSSGWSSIGSTIASPPLLIPRLSSTSDVSSNVVAPIVPISGVNGSAFPADQTARQEPIRSVLASPSQPTTTNHSATDDWAAGWNDNAGAPQATIGRGANNSPRADTSRDFNVSPVQPVAGATQDAKKTTTVKSNDLWADDPWGKPSQPSLGGSAAPTITASATKQPEAASNNSPPLIQPPANSPVLNPPTIGSAPSNINTAGPTPGPTPSATSSPSPSATAAATPVASIAMTANRNPPAPTSTGEQQPWVAMIAVALSLAGSLAANLFLGWSYLDARQKYQSLVRRTADTFRRTKPAAA